MKGSYIHYLLFFIWGFCCGFHVVAQSNISAKEYTILAEQVYDSIKSEKYASLADAIVLRVRYIDLIGKSDIDSQKKMRIYLNGGYDFHLKKLPSESIRCYKLFFDAYEKWESKFGADKKNFFLKERTFAYGLMAMSYSKFNKLDSAALYLKKAISISEPSKTVYYPSSLNNYGLFLNEQKRNRDSVLHYFNQAFTVTQNDFPDDPLLGSIRDNLADIYLEEGALEKAKDFYNQNFQFYGSYRTEGGIIEDVPRFVSAGIQLIRTNIALNSRVNARTHFEILEQSVSADKMPPSTRIDFFNLKQQLFELENQIDSAYSYSKKITILSDSLNLVENKKHEDYTTTLNNIVMDRVKLTHRMQQNQKETQLSRQKLLTWIALLAALVITTIIFLLYQRRNQRLINTENERIHTQQAYDLEKLKSAQLKSDIASKERDLSDFAINLSHNYQWAQELSQKLQQLTESKGRTRAKLLEEFGEEIQNKIEYNHETKDFFNRLDLLNDAFYKKLNNRFPNLSKTEKRLCSLLRLKLDSQQIATFQNITLASVNTARYRLRKKLKLTNDEELNSFIVLL